MTNPVNGSDQGYSPPIPLPNKKNLGQQDFLRLMVAQVMNQDPMSPQANGEFLSQMAQFSTNDGINNMQQSMQQLANSLQSSEALQATSLVGRQVLVNSNKLHLNTEGGANGAIEAVKGMTDVKASIYSSTGELIKTISLGNPEEGIHNFSWDGTNDKGERMPEGNYAMKITTQYYGREEAVPSMASAKVDSVRVSQYGEGVILNVTGIGDISLNDVQQILTAS